MAPGGPLDPQAPPEDTWDPQGPSRHSQGASKCHLRTAQTSQDQNSQQALKDTLRALKGSLSVLKGLKAPRDHLSPPGRALLAPVAFSWTAIEGRMDQALFQLVCFFSSTNTALYIYSFVFCLIYVYLYM